MECLIRNATSADALAISRVIIDTLRDSNAQDYSAQVIEQVERSFSPAAVRCLLGQRQVFVATVDGQVIATASLERDVVRSVFVDSVCQGKGVGKRLIATIEQVALNGGVELLRVPSSITAEGFYVSLGFEKIRDEFHGAERTIVMGKTLVS